MEFPCVFLPATTFFNSKNKPSIIISPQHNAVRTLEKWFLDKKYNPSNKYCRDRIWYNHLEMCFPRVNSY